jgi:hypothetical protein
MEDVDLGPSPAPERVNVQVQGIHLVVLVFAEEADIPRRKQAFTLKS